MKFESYQPCDALKPFVKSFSISEADEPLVYKVLPGTGVVIGFQYRGRLSYVEGGTESGLAISGVTGLMDRYRVFRSSAHIGTVLVFFHDGGAAAFFKEPLHELFRESISLDNFMLRSELLVLEEQLAEAASDVARIRCVEQFLLSQRRPGKADALVMAAVSLIHRSRGHIRIGALADQLNISQRPLEKRFRQVVGASPKKFASIVRIQYILQRYTGSQSLSALGHEAGFFDQAHFIKEFKTFTGETPEKFFINR